MNEGELNLGFSYISDDAFMLGDCFVEQEYNGMTGLRKTPDDQQIIRLEKLDFRRAPTNWLSYLFFFFFHLIYFHFLGPVIMIFMIFSRKLINFGYNMHIIRLSIHSLEGLVSVVLTVLLIICHIRNNDTSARDLDSIDDETYSAALYNKVLIYFLRILIISNKYSTFGDAKIN
jgi:hypothetical protein